MANPFADRIDSVVNVGRFSSNLLQQFGAQKRVIEKGGQWSNTFSNSRGNEIFQDASAVVLTDKLLIPGSIPENIYASVKAYFESRGASSSNSSTMASLTIDTARLMGVTPMSLLEDIGSTLLSNSSYQHLNKLRTPSDQQEITIDINNQKSLKSRSIKA